MEVATESKQHKILKSFAKLILYFFGFYIIVGLLIAFSPLYETIVLRPQGKNILYDAAINNKQEIKFANKNGDQLHAWYFKSTGSKYVALIHHGNAGNITNRLMIVRDFLQLGVSVFLYDYRGYGLSSGKPTISGLIEDGECAYDYVTNDLKYQPDQIIIYGESIGSGVAVRVAKDRPCAGLILQSPPMSLPEVAGDGVIWLKLYPQWVFPEPQLRTKDLIAQQKGPILFIHGMKDTLVLPRHGQGLFALAQEPKQLVLLPNSGHNDIQDKDETEYFAALSKFVESIKSSK